MTPCPPASDGARGDLALVLSGGGARGAYQTGVIRRLAQRFPDLRFAIVTGVSAGAINASFIARITVDHVMASAALPLFFPAVRLGDAWYGDGGVRLSTPLVPALRLGATRILAVSPHYHPSFEEADRPKITGYPPPAQILGHLMDSVFLDVVDEDVRRLEGVNRLLAKLPEAERGG